MTLDILRAFWSLLVLQASRKLAKKSCNQQVGYGLIPKFFDSNKLRFHCGFICLVDSLISQKCHIISDVRVRGHYHSAENISRTVFIRKSIIRALHAPTKIYPGLDGFGQDK